MDPPAFPHYVLSQPSHSWGVCVHVSVRVCCHFFWHSCVRAERQGAQLQRDRTTKPTQKLIKTSWSLPRRKGSILFVYLSYGNLSRLGNSNPWKSASKTSFTQGIFKGKHPLLSSLLYLPSVSWITNCGPAKFKVWESFWAAHTEVSVHSMIQMDIQLLIFCTDVEWAWAAVLLGVHVLHWLQLSSQRVQQ